MILYKPLLLGERGAGLQVQGSGGRPVQDLRPPDVFEHLQTFQLPGAARLHRVARPRLPRNQGAEMKRPSSFVRKKTVFILSESPVFIFVLKKCFILFFTMIDNCSFTK